MNREPPVADLNLLVKKIAQGDETSFRELYDATHQNVFFFLCRMLKHKETAEDILVDTYTAVWNGAKKFQGRSKVQTWIFGIARNLALNALRKQKYESRLEDYPHISTNGGSDTEAVDRRQVIQKALSNLSLKHREVLDWVFFHELDYPEIAKILNISINTVKTRVFYAKKGLLKSLDQMGVKKDDLFT